MKKYVMFTMLTAMMVCLLAVPGDLQAAPDVTVKVNGQYVDFPDQKPYIDHGRTMVPLRAPMEMLGCTVVWDDNAKQATVSLPHMNGDRKKSRTATFTIGENVYTTLEYDNYSDDYDHFRETGQQKPPRLERNHMSDGVCPVIVNSRTAFPIRYAAEAMGAIVRWDAAARTVLINTPPLPEAQPIDPGVVYHPAIGEDYLPSIRVWSWSPERVASACAMLADLTGEPALAAEAESCILDYYNTGNTQGWYGAEEPRARCLARKFRMADGQLITVCTPKNSTGAGFHIDFDGFVDDEYNKPPNYRPGLFGITD